VIVYHSTTPEDAAAILREGFRDHARSFGIEGERMGVWFTKLPRWVGEREGDVVLAVDLPEDVWTEHVWREYWLHPEGVGVTERNDEAFIPAESVNRYGPPRRVDPFADER
jgi:hypothetical protein